MVKRESAYTVLQARVSGASARRMAVCRAVIQATLFLVIASEAMAEVALLPCQCC